MLEDLWLEHPGENYSFYKGLIQLAGAFVHLQKNRLKPAAALFRLAGANLDKYPAEHDQLDVRAVLEEIRKWLARLERDDDTRNPLSWYPAPVIELIAGKEGPGGSTKAGLASGNSHVGGA